MTEIPDNYIFQNCMLSQTEESSCFILFLPIILTIQLSPVDTVTFLNISEPYEQNVTVLRFLKVINIGRSYLIICWHLYLSLDKISNVPNKIPVSLYICFICQMHSRKTKYCVYIYKNHTWQVATSNSCKNDQ